MPHAIIGYAGSTLKAVKMFHNSFPKNDLVVLPDYFGKEIFTWSTKIYQARLKITITPPKIIKIFWRFICS